MKIPLLDLKLQYQGLRQEVEHALREVVESQQFILGPAVEACEREIAAYCGTPYACGVSSGTDALLMALMSEGVQAGDEIVTSPYSFFATSGSIARLGARAVFVDIDPVSFNLDASRIEQVITPKTKAILPVHLFGQMAEMEPILELAGKKGICVIEDAAQAIGAVYRGRRAGSLGDYGCFSFFPSKNLGCFGDGGMITVRDPKRDHQLKALRNHGSDKRYYHHSVGGNFRLDALQAAIVSIKLRHLESWTRKRIENARIYRQLFERSGLLAGQIHLPECVQERHVYNQYVIRAGRRDELMAFLRSRGIGCEVYYPVSLHLQDCFKYWGYKPGDFPESEKASRESLALPVYPELTEEQLGTIVHEVVAFYQ